jgi:hypothetical protein
VGGPWAQVALGHPENGQVLVVGTEDGTLLFYEERPGGTRSPWRLLTTAEEGHGGVNALVFAPREMGPLLAAATGDGAVRCFTPSATCVPSRVVCTGIMYWINVST